MDSTLRDARLDVETVRRSRLGRAWRRDAPLPDPFNRIYFIEEGAAFIFHGGRRRALLPGGLHLIPANTPVGLGCGSFFQVAWLHFTLRSPAGFDIVPHFGCELDLKPGLECGLSGFFDMALASKEGTFEGEMAWRALLFLLLKEFARGVDASSFARRMQELGRFRKVFGLMDSRLSAPPSVEELAGEMAMAPASFSRLFKAVFGSSPGRFSLERRLARSAKLLDEGLKLDEIAFKLGFSDAFHLSKSFKARYGRTPSEYRREGLPRSP